MNTKIVEKPITAPAGYTLFETINCLTKINNAPVDNTPESGFKIMQPKIISSSLNPDNKTVTVAIKVYIDSNINITTLVILQKNDALSEFYVTYNATEENVLTCNIYDLCFEFKNSDLDPNNQFTAFLYNEDPETSRGIITTVIK